MSTLIKFDCEYEKDGEDPGGIITFKLSVAGISLDFSLYEPDAVSKEGWTIFLSSYEKKTKTELYFCSSNGDVSIKLNSENTIFSVTKIGAGGGGSSELVIPNAIAEKVMRKAFDFLCADKSMWK